MIRRDHGERVALGLATASIGLVLLLVGVIAGEEGLRAAGILFLAFGLAAALFST